MRVGDVVLAVGNPLGVGQTVTMGIVSAKGRATGLGDGSYEDFLQTDAPINQGNSGGALVNTAGELVGINSQILSPSGGNIGIGFAVPSNMAKNVMDQLVAERARASRAARRHRAGHDRRSRGGPRPRQGGRRARERRDAGWRGREGRHQARRRDPRATRVVRWSTPTRSATRLRRPSRAPRSTLQVLRDGKTSEMKATLEEIDGEHARRAARSTAKARARASSA